MTRALIVDDHADNRYLLRALLQGHGFVVDEAGNGAEALTRARHEPPDIVVSDLLMPVLDGYMLLRHWRSDDLLKHIPFVVYTATYTEARDERLAMALGADVFIVKPAEPEPFMARIRDVLARYARGELPSATVRAPDERVLLQEYNEVLVRKLETKVREAEQSNLELRADLVRRQQTEETLRLRDRAIQAVSQGILITDPRQPDNPIIYASAGFERMTGYSAEEVRGRNCRFLQGPDTDPETVRTLREAVAGGRACSVEILNYRKDGTPFWLALSLAPVRGDDGTLLNFVGVQSDVTDRRKLEDQLRQAQKMEAVGRLAGGVAHDFNNLLTIICGCGELLLDMPQIGDADREVINAIREAGQRAADLTRQLLAFSRRAVVLPQVLDLNAAITESGKLLHRLIGEDIEVVTEFAPDLDRVKVDPGQLDQVLLNLAVNARDAMPTGGTLTVRTANVRLADGGALSHLSCPGGAYVMLEVSDSGTGMTPEVLSHLFEPFFTTKGIDKGTGLGLSMVFGVVQQSGGGIDVQSAPGAGATFRIYLPVTLETSTAPIEAPPPSAHAGTETVLLVEDERGVRALATRILRMHGYEVLAATNGADALLLAGEHRGGIHLLLTDVVMPGIGGPDLARQLRVDSPHLKVLFMSGYTDDAVVRHGLLDAGVSFIQKPYTPLELARKVRQVLDQGQTTEASLR